MSRIPDPTNDRSFKLYARSSPHISLSCFNRCSRSSSEKMVKLSSWKANGSFSFSSSTRLSWYPSTYSLQMARSHCSARNRVAAFGTSMRLTVTLTWPRSGLEAGSSTSSVNAWARPSASTLEPCSADTSFAISDIGPSLPEVRASSKVPSRTCVPLSGTSVPGLSASAVWDRNLMACRRELLPELFIPTRTVSGLNSTVLLAIDLKFLTSRERRGQACMAQAAFCRIWVPAREKAFSSVGCSAASAVIPRSRPRYSAHWSGSKVAGSRSWNSTVTSCVAMR